MDLRNTQTLRAPRTLRPPRAEEKKNMDWERVCTREQPPTPMAHPMPSPTLPPTATHNIHRTHTHTNNTHNTHMHTAHTHNRHTATPHTQPHAHTPKSTHTPVHENGGGYRVVYGPYSKQTPAQPPLVDRCRCLGGAAEATQDTEHTHHATHHARHTPAPFEGRSLARPQQPATTPGLAPIAPQTETGVLTRLPRLMMG
jgi:hypothetical protein